MKIHHLHAENFLGLRALDVALTKRVNLFAGRNGAGKSSLRDAIALALTADLGRVSLKKEAGQLITDGASAACVAVQTDSFDAEVTITDSGKITDSLKGVEAPAGLHFVLDAQRFARLTATERRAFLFDLMGLSAGGDAVRERLVAKGCDAKKIDRVMPLLRSGFDAACKEAKEKATQAKGAWRAVTGETFGSEKAKTWRAAAPTFDAQALDDALARLGVLDRGISVENQALGALRARASMAAEEKASASMLQEKVEKLPRIRTKLDVDRASLAEAMEKLARAEEARAQLAAKPAANAVLTCPCCNASLLLDTTGQLASVPEDGGADLFGGHAPAADDLDQLAANIAIYRGTRDLMQRAVDAGVRDLADAEAAEAALKSLQDAGPAPSQSEIEAAGARVDELVQQRTTLSAKVDSIRQAKAAADQAGRKTTEAAQHAADVAAWDVLADALSPNGIPAEMLAEALGPINERLAKSAGDVEWPRVEITADMEVRTGLHERPYSLLSESEKWRCDAMLAEAIAFLSGTRLLVLDRFDVLDLQGRVDLLAWLDILASDSEIDTALIFGTLKAAPSNLPETAAAHWIENGVLGQLREAA